MEIIKDIFGGAAGFFTGFFSKVSETFTATDSLGQLYTTVARWIFVALALYILVYAIHSLLRTKNPSEVWAYFHIADGVDIPVTHWENVIGRGKSCDIRIEDMSVSRNHGTLTRGDDGNWFYMDIGSRNGAFVNGEATTPNHRRIVRPGDELALAGARCTIYPVSIEERRNNIIIREEDTQFAPPWMPLIALSVFQFMTMVQLRISLGESFSYISIVSFIGLTAIMWVYVIALKTMRRRGFEMEILAFFLCTLNLAVTASCLPGNVFKQFISIAIGLVFFLFMCAILRDLKRTTQLKLLMYSLAVAFLLFNLAFGAVINGARNWVSIAGITIQPSELVKVAFIWVGAATMEELFRRRSSIVFTGFAIFCFGCLALMGDFGTAIAFFVTFLVISFLRSGDFTKLILVSSVALVAGLMVIRFWSHVAVRFSIWGHVWEPAIRDGGGMQQTRMMTASASGGFVGMGAGNGWLKNIYASWTDLVFGVVTEEWGLIIALLSVMTIITLAIFAYRAIWAGRSTYYTIAGCAATSLILFQTVLNVLGSADLLPLTGIAFPFLSAGGSSMISAWGLLAFLKAADTRQNASIAVASNNKGMVSDDEGEITV